jgi:hypothetical protein
MELLLDRWLKVQSFDALQPGLYAKPPIFVAGKESRRS